MKNHHHNGPVEPGANSHRVIHDTIAARAYELWERSGRPENQAEAFWLAAEREQISGKISPAPNPTPPASS